MPEKEPVRTEEKKAIARALEEFTNSLAEKYLQRLELDFPSQSEFEKLHDLCIRLAQCHGKKRFGFGQWRRAIKLVENRYSKIRVAEFLDKLVVKLARLPVPPRTAIYNAIEKSPSAEGDRRKALQEVYDIVGSSEWRPSIEAHPWDNWLDIIQSLGLETRDSLEISDPHLRSLFHRVAEMPRVNKRLFAYFAFMDLIRQQQLWRNKFHERTKPTILWIYSLQDDAYDAELRKIVQGDAYTPMQVRAALVRIAARERKRKYDKKHSSHTN